MCDYGRDCWVSQLLLSSSLSTGTEIPLIFVKKALRSYAELYDRARPAKDPLKEQCLLEQQGNSNEDPVILGSLVIRMHIYS